MDAGEEGGEAGFYRHFAVSIHKPLSRYPAKIFLPDNETLTSTSAGLIQSPVNDERAKYSSGGADVSKERATRPVWKGIAARDGGVLTITSPAHFSWKRWLPQYSAFSLLRRHYANFGKKLRERGFKKKVYAILHSLEKLTFFHPKKWQDGW